MKNTEKLNLKKPEPNDYVNISDLNGNMDILDKAVGDLQDGTTSIASLETTNKTLSGAINEVKKDATTHNDKNATTISKGHVQIGNNIKVNNGTISVDDASTSAKGVVQLSDSVTSDSKTLAATANSIKTVNDKSDVLNTEFTTHKNDYVKHAAFVTAQGAANAITATIDDLSAYVDGMGIVVKITAQNTGATTINLNGLGAKSIRKTNGSALSGGNFKVGSLYTLRYNSATGFFILQGEGGSGNALASDLLSGKTASTDAGEIVGVMPNLGNVSLLSHISATSNIPIGYYNGAVILPPEAQSGDKKIWERSGTGKTLSSYATFNLHMAGPTINKKGTYRISFRISGSTSNVAYCRIYISGVPRGQIRSSTGETYFSEDLAINSDERIEFWAYCQKNGYPYAHLEDLWVGISEPSYIS